MCMQDTFATPPLACPECPSTAEKSHPRYTEQQLLGALLAWVLSSFFPLSIIQMTYWLLHVTLWVMRALWNIKPLI